jgi:hypothetical protein
MVLVCAAARGLEFFLAARILRWRDAAFASCGTFWSAAAATPLWLCAEYVRHPGGASPPHNLMEVKCERTARASP